MMPDGWKPPAPMTPIVPIAVPAPTTTSSTPSSTFLPHSQSHNDMSSTAPAATMPSAIQTSPAVVKASQELGPKSDDNDSDGHGTLTPMTSLPASAVSLVNASPSPTRKQLDDSPTKKEKVFNLSIKQPSNALFVGSGSAGSAGGGISSGSNEPPPPAPGTPLGGENSNSNSATATTPVVDSPGGKEGSGWGWFKKGEKGAKKG